MIFDNFEHLADGAGIVSAILEAAPDTDVIATSRSRLEISGEAVLSLGGLDTVWADSESALKTSGVELFLDSARRVNPSIDLGEDDLTALREILRLTDGMPLGILLAAAWVDMLSIPDIAAEIAKNLDFLESTAVDMPDRHRSVRAVFRYSWDLLSTGERAIFAALSVFRGGFTREAAEAVTGASLRDLAGLARKSLLWANPETGRYSVHELLRQFAEEELASDTRRQPEVLQLHAEYYANLARDAFDAVHSPHQSTAMEILEPDLDNLRLAWRHHVDTDDPGRLYQMVGALWWAHELRGWYHAGLALLNPALDRVQTDDKQRHGPAFRASALAVHGAFAGVLGRHVIADATSEQALSVARVSNDPESLLMAFHLRAQTLVYLGRMTEVPPIIEEATALVEGAAGTGWETGRFWATGLKNIEAFALLAIGEIEQASSLLDESRDRLEPLGELFYMSWNYGHRARLAMRESRLDDAAHLFSQSADRARKLGSLRPMQIALFGLGDARLEAGDPTGAQRAFVESLSAAERTGMVAEMLATIVRIAKAMAADGQTRGAVELLATVEAEPDSVSQFFIESEAIKVTASAALGDLEPLLDDVEFVELRARGARRHYRDVVKELAETADRSLSVPGGTLRVYA